MSKRNVTRLVGVLVKLAVAGASIVAVAWLILIVDTQGDVRETTADIISLDPVPVSNTERFENALDSLGHTEPQSFDYNGNDVYFSTRTTHKKPDRLLREYQRAFVENGVNEKSYLPYGPAAHNQGERAGGGEPIDYEERRDAMLSGQMVPVGLTDNYMSMAGGMLEGGAQTRAQLNNYLEGTDYENFGELFTAYRKVEAFRRPDSNSTLVTASWSDEQLDIEKHAENTHPDKTGVNPDITIPSCPDCRRQIRFDGGDNAKPYTVNNYVGPSSTRETAEFYRKAMRNRGWRPTDTSHALGDVLSAAGVRTPDSRLLQFTRNGEFVTLFVRGGNSLDKTSVTAYQTD